MGAPAFRDRELATRYAWSQGYWFALFANYKGPDAEIARRVGDIRQRRFGWYDDGHEAFEVRIFYYSADLWFKHYFLNCDNCRITDQDFFDWTWENTEEWNKIASGVLGIEATEAEWYTIRYSAQNLRDHCLRYYPRIRPSVAAIAGGVAYEILSVQLRD